MVDSMFVSYLLAQSGMDGVVRPSTHVQGVKNVISGVTALGLRPQNF